MKPELAFKLAQGIQLLHLDGNHYYTNAALANCTGISTSTIKRNHDIVKMLDIVLHLSNGDDDGQP